ncbi:nucleoside kinase [Acidaminococcus timonensis]|uniref:nucleoside kinase n=1 Tax=Acidaminococcus timonensis TaxID=1871002 RepID=UPI0029427BE7|nr:nucleoside kinase [Acidaminococcus timonensis]
MEITGPDGKVKSVHRGTPLMALAREYQSQFPAPIALATVDGRATPLQLCPEEGAQVKFCDLSTEAGYRAYIATFQFALIVAMAKERPEVRLEVENTFGDGLYCAVKNKIFLSKYDLEDIARCMEELIRSQEPIEVKTIAKDDAWPYVNPRFYDDQAPLLEAVPKEYRINIYQLAGESAFFVSPLLPNLGYLQKFELVWVGHGILLRFGGRGHLDVLEPYQPRKKLGEVYAQAERLGQVIHCPTVAALNKFIREGNSRGIIQMCEAYHEKSIARIADEIAADGRRVKLVLIAGPSSSGKTTFSQRLSVQMRVNGLRPIPISLDNYFKEREQTPRLPDGSYDFESIEALDTELFNEHMEQLIDGKTVDIPHFNFKSGHREYRGQQAYLGDDGVLVVEGIHGMNEKLSARVRRRNKLKIYISALTPLSFDDYNRIPTTDMRLLRRMVRDSQFRSHNARQTIENWPKVRQGEERNIFPFSEEADIMFNTTLIYELAVFKKYACPLLEQIPREAPEYPVARNFLDMLQIVESIDDKAIPNNSIIREFIGHSIFGDLL